MKKHYILLEPGRMTCALWVKEKGKVRMEREEVLQLPEKAKKAAICSFIAEQKLSGIQADLLIDGGILRESVVPKARPGILNKMAEAELSALSPPGKKWIMAIEPYKKSPENGIHVTGAMLEEDKLNRALYCMKEAGIRIRGAYLLASCIGSLAKEETTIIVSRESGGFRLFLIEEGVCILTRTVVAVGEEEGESLNREIRRILLRYQSRAGNQKDGGFSVKEIRITGLEGKFPELVRKETEESLGLPCKKLELGKGALSYKLAAAIGAEGYAKRKHKDLLHRKKQIERRTLVRRFHLPGLVLPFILALQIGILFAVQNYLEERGRQEYGRIEELREYVENPERISLYRERKAALEASGKLSVRAGILEEEKPAVRKKKSLEFSDYQVLIPVLGEEKRIIGISFQEDQLTLELELKNGNMAADVSSCLKAAEQYENVRLSGWEESLDGQGIFAQFQIKLREKTGTAEERGEGIETY